MQVRKSTTVVAIELLIKVLVRYQNTTAVSRHVRNRAADGMF